MELASALVPGGNLVCVVGAGGKKSTLYSLAGQFDRAVVTATVRIPIFDQHVAGVRVTESPREAVATASTWPLGVVPEREREDRYRGYDTDTVAALADSEAVEVTLVKADGARMRELKAPAEREPQLPAATDVVVPIASVHAVGEPLSSEVVHRPERVAAVTGRSVGDEIRPTDVADLLSSPAAGLKDVPPDATVIPVVNKVDDDALASAAREIAHQIHDRADVAHVALTQMTAAQPLVAVVE